ncbi:short chain dehydrogenase reductase [Grosmannia clavigera kw1407]|uniref:Short chain dehydrogenase reductase n=1 Tax=Grosmannia clavigera (strain kw1407 / UAMH 11150) TaxID=655863 RepID=F0XU82_GROCL|nr:short chain dehydrogenase reductase [Grosmannia clavigera kw1407]EFW99057.1 short chain dehydrogenase reductase [Grosmannia clavigera kw1407]
MSVQDPSLLDTNWLDVAGYVSARKDTYPFIDSTKADLTGKSVLITGASKGIGKATAISFATAGCSKILLAARSDLADVEKAVHDAALKANRPQPFVQCLNVDVTSEDSMRAAAETATALLDGSLDVLVSNAGYLEEWKPIAESEPSEWWRTWEVNIKGTYLAAHFFVPLLLQSQTKTVINISSGGAHVIFPGASAYQTTKFALCRLTEFLDKEYRQQGLIAIALHPGAVKTELSMNMPLERQVILTDTPELAADTLIWLARERRDWLAGRFVSVSWDMEELEQKKQDILQRNLFKFRVMV